MIYGSVCSGIEAASCAWHPLGWEAAFLSEIEPFPRAVLAHHFPEVPLHGDFTTIQAGDYRPIDLLVGGTPCQSFSIAGLRGGLDDDRGNLALEYLRLADRLRPKWLVWENVPGVLSSNGGRDFGSILGGMVQLGYGFAYRVLDAQFFGVAQRRRRVFVIGHLGDWRPAAAVLFERHSLRGDPPPSRTAGKGTSANVAPSLVASGRGVGRIGDTRGQDPLVAVPAIANPLTARMHKGVNTTMDEGQTMIVEPVAYSIMPMNSGKDYKARETDIAQPVMTSPVGGNQGGDYVVQPMAFDAVQITSAANRTRVEPDIPASTLSKESRMHVAFAIQERAICENPNAGPDGAGFRADGAAYTLEARTVPQAVASALQVRRLTPTECERLQGFPDGWTAIPYRGKPASDGPRYKALGNSMAVPVMAWIGRRIAAVENLHLNQRAA
jgi:DNA (cytosine-5)-methyltransferase 1